jgi:hypothetical protein
MRTVSSSLLILLFLKSTLAAAFLPPHDLQQAIHARLMKVPEFQFIHDEAQKLGVRVWLFGGTAAGFAHYVKWDLQREHGDTRFQPDRFDYDYTNIYRSTQDLDIVIDGNADQIRELQYTLQNQYPHLQGSKTAWEVRGLRQPIADKEPLLDNPDFLNQHTDSNSTGMIELTGSGEVRDLRNWDSTEPQFLKDVAEGKLRYYYSPEHEMTTRFKKGMNPPIFSVVRFLTKAFQYELEIRPADLVTIKKIIDDFEPNRHLMNSYSKDWLEKNGKKLIQHAVNIEYAWNTLEKLGLREKLIHLKNDAATEESLAWWMGKEPLRTYPIGQGAGKTAGELGLTVLAHETKNFLAYESITRAHTGDANVLISRMGARNENAVHGDGFYTRKGRRGATGTGLTIRLEVNPEAREGTDFRLPFDDYVVVLNKAAIRVIPESLRIGPFDYLTMLANGALAADASDQGIFEKLKRRIAHQMSALTPEETATIFELFDRKLEEATSVTPFLSETIELLGDKLGIGRLRALLNKVEPRAPRFAQSVIVWILNGQATRSPKQFEEIIETLDTFFKDRPGFFNDNTSLVAKSSSDVFAHFFSSEYFLSQPKAFQILRSSTRSGVFSIWTVQSILLNNKLKVNPKELKLYILDVLKYGPKMQVIDELGRPDLQLLERMRDETFHGQPGTWTSAFSPNELNRILFGAGYLMNASRFENPADWEALVTDEKLVKKLIYATPSIEKAPTRSTIDQFLAKDVFPMEFWARHKKGAALLKLFIENTGPQLGGDSLADLDLAILENIFNKHYWMQPREAPSLVISIFKRHTSDYRPSIRKKTLEVMGDPSWTTHPNGHEIVNTLVDYYNHHAGVQAPDLMRVLSLEGWLKHPLAGTWFKALLAFEAKYKKTPSALRFFYEDLLFSYFRSPLSVEVPGAFEMLTTILNAAQSPNTLYSLDIKNFVTRWARLSFSKAEWSQSRHFKAISELINAPSCDGLLK